MTSHFQWWAPYTISKWGAIPLVGKARIRHMSIKYGIKVPRTIEKARAFDLTAGNTMWQDAIDLDEHDNASI